MQGKKTGLNPSGKNQIIIVKTVMLMESFIFVITMCEATPDFPIFTQHKADMPYLFSSSYKKICFPMHENKENSTNRSIPMSNFPNLSAYCPDVGATATIYSLKL